jgi:predicted dehydrogenase
VGHVPCAGCLSCDGMGEPNGSWLPTCRIVVVGAGGWGINIVRDLVTLGVEVSVVDPDLTARQNAEIAGASSTLSAWSGVGAVDGVVISTPASTHEQVLTEVAAGTSVPIACEKPLAVSAESARRMIELAGGRLTVLHTWRYHPGVTTLAELAKSGRLGTVTAVESTRVNWTSPRTDVDPVWTLLPHDVSVALAILGEVPTVVSSEVERIDHRAVGVWAMFRTAVGTPFVATASTRSPEKRREIRVHGTDAVAVWSDRDEASVNVYSGNVSPPHTERIRLSSDMTALQIELDAFRRHVEGGSAPVTDAAEGLRVVEAVQATLDLARGT